MGPLVVVPPPIIFVPPPNIMPSPPFVQPFVPAPSPFVPVQPVQPSLPVSSIECRSLRSTLDQYELTTISSYFLRSPTVGRQLVQQFTLFAPTNTALRALQIPSGVIVDDYIALVLKAHGVLKPYAASAFGVEGLLNLNGQTLDTSRVVVGATTTNQVCVKTTGVCASVTVADIPVCNGYVHIIDTVLE